jgi:hypothetical protein
MLAEAIMNHTSYVFVALVCLLSSPAFAETIDVYDDHGGVVPEYDRHWAEEAAQGDFMNKLLSVDVAQHLSTLFIWIRV